MLMLDSSSGPLPLVCLTANDPPKPPLFEKIGTVSIKASDNQDVQAYFDQGLRLYMGFNNRESYRAFRYAARRRGRIGFGKGRGFSGETISGAISKKENRSLR